MRSLRNLKHLRIGLNGMPADLPAIVQDIDALVRSMRLRTLSLRGVPENNLLADIVRTQKPGVHLQLGGDFLPSFEQKSAHLEHKNVGNSIFPK